MSIDSVPASTSTGSTLAVGTSTTGTIDSIGDEDWYRVSLTAGHQYRFDLKGAATGQGTLGDPLLRLLNGSGSELALNDDSGNTLDSSITFTASQSGTYFLSAQGFFFGTGTFLLGAADLTGSVEVPGSTATSSVAPVGSPVAGTLEAAGDQDWYQVSLEAGHQYRFDLHGAGGQGSLEDPLLRLLDGSGIELALNDDSGGALDSSITFTASQSGTYFLSAQGYASEIGAYVLGVTDLSGDTDDVPGGTGSASAMAVGGFVSGTINTAGDQDWYQVPLVAGQQYRFDLQGASGQGALEDPLLRLLDGSGFELAGNDDSGGTLDSSFTFTAFQSGTYFLSAQGFGSETGAFLLSATDLGGLADVAAGTGTADSVSTAAPATGTIDASGDQDWYQVSLVAGHQYRFDLQGATAGQGSLSDPLLRLLNGSGSLLATNDDSGGTLDSSIVFTASQSGTHFLSAQAYGSDFGTFTLAVTDLSTGAADVPGSAATPSSVTIGGSASGTIDAIGDDDWYRVTLSAGQQYRFELKGLDSGQGTLSDPVLRLLDGAGSELAFNDDSGITLDSSITFTASQSGTHFLSAQGFFFATGTFTLSATSLGAGEIPGDLSTLSSVAVPGSLTGTINTIGDEDWYRISLTGGNQYQFDLQGISAGGTLNDPMLRLLDGSGAQLAFNDDSGGTLDSSITFVAGQTGTYFLSAQGYSDATGTFALSATNLGSGDIPGNTGTFGTVSAGGSVTGTLEVELDQDWYQVSLIAGRQYRFDLEGTAGSQGLDDPLLWLLDGSGFELTYNDDSGGTLDSSILFTATQAGTYFLSAEGYDVATGDYLLSVTDLSGSDGQGEVITGTPGPDTVSGTEFDDTLNGAGGADLLDGKEGDDVLGGGADDDVLAGGVGNDTIRGGGGDDRFAQATLESLGNDSVMGGPGEDTVSDQYGNNVLRGGADDDLFLVFVADAGTNSATGGAGQDTWRPLPGMSPASNLAYVVNDFVVGAGGDLLDVNELLLASVGFAFGADSSTTGYLQLLQSGPDTLLQWDRDGAAGASYTWVTQLTLKNIDATKLTAHNFVGTIDVGTKSDDDLGGQLGNDTIFGAGGDDTMDGSSGADSMAGGDGDDVYFVDDPKDLVIEISNALPPQPAPPGAEAAANPIAGITDTVIASINYSLANVANVENLILDGAAASGTGNALANDLVGNALANTLAGLGGDDSILGGGGDDTLRGAAGGDTLRGGAGGDEMRGGDGDDFQYAGAGNDSLYGGPGSDTSRGGPDADVLRSGGGNDTVYGGAGNDTLYGGPGNDVLTGGADADRFMFNAAPGSADADTVADFTSGADQIVLDPAVFTALAPGALAAGSFREGTSAVDPDDFMLYEASSGSIFYDADGSGTGASPALIAQVGVQTALTAGSFLIGA